MVDLRQYDGRYYFRIGGGDGFLDTVELVKNVFSPQERDFDDDTEEWSVPATELSEAKLAMIFSDAPSIFEYLRAQLPLRNVSSIVRQLALEFSEQSLALACSQAVGMWTTETTTVAHIPSHYDDWGLLIQTSCGKDGGLGSPRTKRSG